MEIDDRIKIVLACGCYKSNERRTKMSINPWLLFWLTLAIVMLIGSYL